MKDKLRAYQDLRIRQYVAVEEKIKCEHIERKRNCMANRNAEIVKVKAEGTIKQKREIDDYCHIDYFFHLQFLIKQKEFIYIEEKIENRKAIFKKGKLIYEECIPIDNDVTEEAEIRLSSIIEEAARAPYTYNRLKAVQYAEKWWNNYNPAYKSFDDDDCTNYISQCLYAGGAPMQGYPNRSRGWWMQHNNWSFSWTVANAMQGYLSSAKSGLRAMKVNSPLELKLGDVICYDFEGNGRFDHTTIVTGKDGDGMPLVNAHTNNSRMRYWSYEDSAAYTDQINYKFFTIKDDS